MCLCVNVFMCGRLIPFIMFAVPHIVVDLAYSFNCSNIILFKENGLTTRGMILALCVEEKYLSLYKKLTYRRDSFSTSIY